MPPPTINENSYENMQRDFLIAAEARGLEIVETLQPTVDLDLFRRRFYFVDNVVQPTTSALGIKWVFIPPETEMWRLFFASFVNGDPGAADLVPTVSNPTGVDMAFGSMRAMGGTKQPFVGNFEKFNDQGEDREFFREILIPGNSTLTITADPTGSWTAGNPSRLQLVFERLPVQLWNRKLSPTNVQVP